MSNCGSPDGEEAGGFEVSHWSWNTTIIGIGHVEIQERLECGLDDVVRQMTRHQYRLWPGGIRCASSIISDPEWLADRIIEGVSVWVTMVFV